MSLPKIVLETEKTVPVYGLPLRIRQGDKGEVLTVLLGKSFVTTSDLTDVDVTLMAERSDQTLVKAVASEKSGNTFSVTLPDAMYAKVGVFRRVYFKIGNDSTSDIKIEVLSGTGSSSANGNYIQDFEDLLAQAMSYVYTLNSLAGTYDAVIDKTVAELTKKMTDFVAKAQEDLDAAKKSYAESQTQSETDAKNQRSGFDTKFNELMSADKSEFKTITDNFNKVIADGNTQNTANQDVFNTAETNRETDFTNQAKEFESRYVKQNGDFETRYKSTETGLKSDYDSFKKILTDDIGDVNKQLETAGTDVTALQAKAKEINDSLNAVDLTQMATNKTDIANLKADNITNKATITKLRTDTDANTKKFDNYATTAIVDTKIADLNNKKVGATEVAASLTKANNYTDSKTNNLLGGQVMAETDFTALATKEQKLYFLK